MHNNTISNFIEFEEAVRRSANPIKGYVSKYQYTVSAKALKQLKYFNKLGNDKEPRTGARKFKTVSGRMRYFNNLIQLLRENAIAAGQLSYNSADSLVISQDIYRISEHHAIVLHDILDNPGLAEAQMTLLNVAEHVTGFSYMHRHHNKSRPRNCVAREFEEKRKHRVLRKSDLLFHILTAETSDLLSTARLLSQIFSTDHLMEANGE